MFAAIQRIIIQNFTKKLIIRPFICKACTNIAHLANTILFSKLPFLSRYRKNFCEFPVFEQSFNYGNFLEQQVNTQIAKNIPTHSKLA